MLIDLRDLSGSIFNSYLCTIRLTAGGFRAREDFHSILTIFEGTCDGIIRRACIEQQVVGVGIIVRTTAVHWLSNGYFYIIRYGTSEL